MARNLPSNPHPNFLDMRRAFRTKISLGLRSYFISVHNRSALAQGIPTEHWLSRTPDSMLFFQVERLVSASAGATPPLHGTVRGLLGWKCSVYQEYEVDINFF